MNKEAVRVLEAQIQIAEKRYQRLLYRDKLRDTGHETVEEKLRRLKAGSGIYSYRFSEEFNGDHRLEELDKRLEPRNPYRRDYR